jgi:hypothetical protein
MRFASTGCAHRLGATFSNSRCERTASSAARFENRVCAIDRAVAAVPIEPGGLARLPQWQALFRRRSGRQQSGTSPAAA